MAAVLWNGPARVSAAVKRVAAEPTNLRDAPDIIDGYHEAGWRGLAAQSLRKPDAVQVLSVDRRWVEVPGRERKLHDVRRRDELVQHLMLLIV